MELNWRTSSTNKRNMTASFGFDGAIYHLTVFVIDNENYKISIKRDDADKPDYLAGEFERASQAVAVCEELIKQLEEEVGARPKEQIYDGSGYGDNAYYGEIERGVDGLT